MVSMWGLVTNSLAKGLVLTPILFLLYIIMLDGMYRYMNLFTDDTKVMKFVASYDRCRELQGNTDGIYRGKSGKWSLMQKKCHIMETGKMKPGLDGATSRVEEN